MRSQSFSDLSGPSRSAVLSLCLTAEDLKHLGVWHNCPRGQLCSDLQSRRRLDCACSKDAFLARRVCDQLDMRFADTVILVRCMELNELLRLQALWISQPNGEALPGLVWALCSDARPEVHGLGAQLGQAALLRGCRLLVDGV